MTTDEKQVTAQEHAEKIIRKHGGERTDDGKWDMSKGVEREKAKADGR